MKEEQWKVAHVTHDGKLVHNSLLKMQLMSDALKRGYDETAEITGYQYLQTAYTENEDEYLVSGAQLKCTMATTEKITIEGRTYIPENPSEITYLECEENLMESGEGKVNATTKDCVVYKNIKPFRCNCKVKPCSEEEKDMLLTDESCLTEGTCKAFIDLNGSWENYPAETPHFEYEDERFGKVSGITMMSMLFCKHGGLITPITSGQEMKKYPSVHGEFVGYLAYDKQGITQDPEKGYYMLYDGPTVAGEGREYLFADIYENHWKDEIYGSPIGCLQGYCDAASSLNKENDKMYYEGYENEDDDIDPRRGTVIHEGKERHAIALGPALQNPNFTTSETGEIKVTEMIYGTYVDVTIVVEGETYYIPAVVVDVKAHTRGSDGYCQTNELYKNMTEEERNEEKKEHEGKDGGNIVEWYVIQEDEEGNNKAPALFMSKDSLHGGIIIYDDKTMAKEK